MPSPLVATKLYPPRLRPGLVARPRLADRLGGAAQARLTLLSAPAGFGKTTVLAEWLAAADRRVAWLSLDERDRRPATFWSYVVTALRGVVPAAGAALPLLQSRAPVETALTTVVNALSTAPGEVYLVLDDYHLVDGPELQPGMVFLLDHLPPQAHLVVSTRADPALPLARLRARGELVELRAADLRFTVEEVASYLTGTLGLALTVDQVKALEGRTEGWVAALQLAALSMQGRADPAGFIAGFAGDDRYIVDYLVDEVLARQPAEVRSFLLQTCVLDRLSGPLCDALTGRADGKPMLESLERRNLFVAPLDDRRRWYRYHHLFAEVLHTHLVDEQPELVPRLHRRASEWYERHGEPASAIRHALAAGDVERAAGLAELAIPELQRTRQEATIREWLAAIPEQVVRARPVLAVGFVGALMAGEEFDGVEERLRAAEAFLARPDDPAMVVVDRAGFARLPATIEMYRAALALGRGDTRATIDHARLAVDRSDAEDHLVRAAASGLMGLARWRDGDLAAAYRSYADCSDGLRRAGHISDVLGCAITLADLATTQGRLAEAHRIYQDALRLADRGGGEVPRGAADMYVGLAQLAIERGDLPTARDQLRRAEALGESSWLPQNPYRWRVATAQLREAEGDLAGAIDLLDAAQRVYTGDYSPDVRPISAQRARVLVAAGRVDDAVRWAREHRLPVDDELSYLREFEHITLATVRLAEGAVDDAARLLDRLLAAAEAGGRTGNVIEILVLRALTHQTRGEGAPALAALARALDLAEPEGYVWTFLREGPPVASLLRRLANRRAGDYVRRLLRAGTAGEPGSPAAAAGLVEPLSERERDVLRLLASDLDGPDIARELRVSLNTLRTHTKHIYTKLGVNSRRAAIRRATELNLLAGDR